MTYSLKPKFTLIFYPLIIVTLFISISAYADNNSSATTTSTTMNDEQIQKLFESAMTERNNGEIFSSIQTFEYLLSRRPSLNRARLELAVSYYRASRYKDALHELQTVLNDPKTPEKVKLSILAYLGQIRRDQQKPASRNQFSYYARAGVLYNDNINLAPFRDIPNIANNIEITSPGIDTFFSASHRYTRKKPVNAAGSAASFQWQSQASWTGDNFTRNSDYNLNVLSLSTGPALVVAGHWSGSATIQVDQIYFGKTTLGTYTSLNPLLTFELGNYRSITLEASYTDNNFTQSADNGRDGHTALGGIAYTTLLGGVDNGLETGFRLSDRKATDNQFGYNSYELYLGGFIATGKKSNIRLNIHLQQYNYAAPDTISGSNRVRDELEGRYTLGYNRDFSAGIMKNWTMNIHGEYTQNNSNITAFSYKTTTVGINFAKYFQ